MHRKCESLKMDSILEIGLQLSTELLRSMKNEHVEKISFHIEW